MHIDSCPSCKNHVPNGKGALCEKCGASQGKSGPLHVAAALPRVVLVDWEERYKRDLHNFMELERWLNKNHPSVMEEWENS